MPKHRFMEVMVPDGKSTPALAFVIVQGRSLIDVVHAIACAANIELTITVEGKRDGETIMTMRTLEGPDDST